MAVDTALKRFTIISVTEPWRMLIPPADGTVAAVDRLGYPYLYAGIAPASSADLTTPWINHESVTSFGTHASGYTSNPTVVRNTDVHQAYQADIDE